MDFPGISLANYESVEYYTILGGYLSKEINMLCTYPGGEMPYIILLVHCVWMVVLSGYITITCFKNNEYVDVAFFVFVQIHHHHVSNKTFCSKKMNLGLIPDTSVNFNAQMSRTPSEYLQ